MQQEKVYIVTQWMELVAAKKISAVNPVHIMMNLIGMVIFPFVGSPLIRNRTGLSIDEFNALMEERKKLIPIWVNAILHTPYP
jgi:hypothetical protein